jgi:hypothetical protein
MVSMLNNVHASDHTDEVIGFQHQSCYGGGTYTRNSQWYYVKRMFTMKLIVPLKNSVSNQNYYSNGTM